MKEQQVLKPVDESLPHEDPLTPVWSRRNWVHEEATHLAAEAEADKRRRFPALKVG
jgi:hypothetical protein